MGSGLCRINRTPLFPHPLYRYNSHYSLGAVVHRLSFCKLQIIDQNIVEVMLDEGVEISGQMVDEFFDAITGKMNEEISILLDKATNYSYKFDALIQLSELTKIQNIGVVTYGSVSRSSAIFMMERFNKSNKNVELFENREDALAWLCGITQQQQ